MKAQRRHELQKNELAKVITKAPSYWQEFGGRTLLMFIAALAIGLLIRYRISSSRAAAAAATESLTSARESIMQLQLSGMAQAPPQDIASRRRSLFSEASSALDQVNETSDDPTLLAEAQIARGDLNWMLASMPEMPGAATQPALQVTRDPEGLLKTAEEAYQTVLNKYADREHAMIAARFGLGAIAENRGQWDAAKQQYETIASIAGVPQAYLEQARIRLQKLPELKQPVQLATPTTIPVNLSDLPTTQQQMAALPPTIAAPRPATQSATAPTPPPGVAPIPPKPPTTAPKPSPTTAR